MRKGLGIRQRYREGKGLNQGARVWEVGRGEDLCLRKARVDCGSEEEVGVLGRTGRVSHVPCAFRNNPGETRALSRSPHPHPAVCTHCFSSHYFARNSHSSPRSGARISFLPR